MCAKKKFEPEKTDHLEKSTPCASLDKSNRGIEEKHKMVVFAL
jgi:hypothetical protein